MYDMEKLKLISVKVDPETLEKLDALVRDHHYWKRNTIINAILTAVVDGMDCGSIYDMIRYSRRFDSIETASFKLEVQEPF